MIVAAEGVFEEELDVIRLWRCRRGGKGDVEDDAWREIVTSVSVNSAGIAVELASDNNDIPIDVDSSVVVIFVGDVTGIGCISFDSGPRISRRVAVLRPVLLPI